MLRSISSLVPLGVYSSMLLTIVSLQFAVANRHRPSLAFSIGGFAFVLLGLAMLLVLLLRNESKHRWQLGWVLAVTSLCLSTGLFLVFDFLDGQPAEYFVYAMPVVFSILSLILFRFGFPKSSRSMLKSLTQSIVEPVVVLDQCGRLLEANAAAVTLLKDEFQDAQEPITQPNVPVHLLLRDDSQLRSVLCSSFAGEREIDLSNKIRQKIVSAQRIPLCQQDVGSTGCLFLLHDKTRQHLLFDDLQHYTHRVAHELRNPLTSIVSLAEILNNQSTDETASQITADLLSSSERMRELIDEMLILDIPYGGQVADLVPIDVYAHTCRLVERIRETDPQSNVEMVTPAPWPMAWGKGSWVDRVLFILMLMAMERVGERPCIRISAESIDQEVYIAVSGHGLGKSSSCRPPFAVSSYRYGKPFDFPRGFGPSIVRRLVQRQGGKLGWDTLAGQKTRAWFTLREAATPDSRNIGNIGHIRLKPGDKPAVHD